MQRCKKCGTLTDSAPITEERSSKTLTYWLCDRHMSYVLKATRKYVDTVNSLPDDEKPTWLQRLKESK